MLIVVGFGDRHRRATIGRSTSYRHRDSGIAIVLLTRRLIPDVISSRLQQEPLILCNMIVSAFAIDVPRSDGSLRNSRQKVSAQQQSNFTSFMIEQKTFG